MALQKEVSPIVIAAVLGALLLVGIVFLARAMSPHERVMTPLAGHGFAAAEQRAMTKYHRDRLAAPGSPATPPAHS